LNRFDSSHAEGSKKPSGGTEKVKQKDLKSLSPGELVRNANIKRDIDLVLAFGYYLEKHSGLKSFSPRDINTCYYDAKIETSNTSQFVILLIKKGFLMEAKKEKTEKGKKKYTLTQTGLDAAEKLLSQNGKQA
jgi:predicted transcriptional regulator